MRCAVRELPPPPHARASRRWFESSRGRHFVKKSVQLKMPFGTASGRLRKTVMFSLLRRLDACRCFRCGREIETAVELSIDHKVPWLDSDDPIALFFDLDNVAFSHSGCNTGAARRSNQKYFDQESKIKAYRVRHAATMRRNYTPEKRKNKYLTTGH